MRKLASIATIATAEPIPEADRLDAVTLEGKDWSIVTDRNEFRPGALAVVLRHHGVLQGFAEQPGRSLHG